MADASDSDAPSDRARARLGAALRGGVRRFLLRAKEVLLVDPDQHGKDGRAELAQAEELARTATQLKGGTAKVAQLMAYLEGPGTAQDAGARAALGALWDRAAGADPAAIRRVVEEDLGAPIEEKFREWSDTPLAAASLGEVHDAVTHAGERVAVKVQYPGIAEGLRNDLDSRALLRQLAGHEVGRALTAEALETLKQAVLRELDYVAERQALEKFAQRWRASQGEIAQIVLPKSFPALSGPRVLTAEKLEGTALLTWAAEAPEAERAAVALTVFRFAWGSPMLFGLLNADPNPGNYLVLDGAAGRVGFLDFGCASELDEETLASDRRVFQALFAERPDEFRAALSAEGLVRDARVLDSGTYREWERHLAGPLRGERFRWTAMYARDLAALTSQLVRAGALHLPPPALLLWRQRLGVAAVLGSIGATADYRSEMIAIVRRARLLAE